MIPETYRAYESGTLMDLVSYGDPEEEEPARDEIAIGPIAPRICRIISSR